jgi:peptide/nickel transport system permease protein
MIAMILSIIIGIPLGIAAALHNGKWQDNVSMFFALLGVSMPGFWLGLMLVLLFSVTLGWLPSSGIGGWQYFILPGITNACMGIATQARQTRSAVLEVVQADYVTTARAKGVTEKGVLWKHIFPNTMIPVVTALGTGFAAQMGGTVIIENVFSIPGLGQYVVNAIGYRDYYAVQGAVIVIAITFSLIILAIDIIYAYLDPRIKAQFVKAKVVKKAHA